ncbi:disease resistance protein RGA2-like [Camellia sinensis]|nr:disease resistance protein RGA2-like [Camellia sinensis]
MAETLVSNIAGAVLKKIASLALPEINLAWGVKNELRKLENTLSTIKSVLLDAEKQQAKNHAVKDWLEKLKDVVYDIDDVLDDFSTETLRWKVEVCGSLIKEVSNFFSSSNPLVFRSKMGQKIKKVRLRLDHIAADKRNFHFTEQVMDIQVQNTRRVQTHSFVRTSDVIGRDCDKETIIELLLSSCDHENLSIIPIVGLGGLGKTTLTKLVYNDERVEENFERKMWVCVSEDFDLKMLIEKIIRSATGANCPQLDIDQLQTYLRDNLNGKKFLLVLDDVWNEDLMKWKELRDLLMGGANGSKIIVTTRSKKTASIMGTNTSYNLGGLSSDECLSLFMKYAFRGGEEKKHPNLVEIGKTIVKKCGGVPLAVITLGSLLYMKAEERDWLYVRDNDIWKLEQKENDILPALRLSYDQMPLDLKQCFAYLSFYPKDYDMLKDNVIQVWIAQGLIQQPDGNQLLEDIGDTYVNELVSRSFLEVVADDGEIELRMHDIVHDLALSIAGAEWLTMNSDTTKITGRVRHIMFPGHDLSERKFSLPLQNLTRVRSFSFQNVETSVSLSSLDMLMSTFKCLRVLAIKGADFEELPSSVGNLIHLRHLDLSCNRCIRKLPDSICKLLNLQTLNLFMCMQLQDLPKGIGKLINLRALYLTSYQSCLPEKELEGLTSLQFLYIFHCKHLTSLSSGMQHLKALRTLVISHCPGLTSLPSEMKYLIALETLHIFFCPELDLLEGEGMQGIKNLRSLILESLPKLVALPEGLQHAASTLQCLRILRCTGFATIPEWLRNFTSLQKLELEYCPLLCPSEGMRSLPPVQELRIKGSSNLSRICRREIDDAIDLQSEPDNHSYPWRAIHIPDDVSLDSDAYDLDIYLEHKDFETDSYDIGNMDDDKSEDTNSAYSFSMPDC